MCSDSRNLPLHPAAAARAAPTGPSALRPEVNSGRRTEPSAGLVPPESSSGSKHPLTPLPAPEAGANPHHRHPRQLHPGDGTVGRGGPEPSTSAWAEERRVEGGDGPGEHNPERSRQREVRVADTPLGKSPPFSPFRALQVPAEVEEGPIPGIAFP